MKVTVDSDSEGEEDAEEEELVVEVEQRPSSFSVKDRIIGRQFEHMQVSHNRLDPKLELCWTFMFCSHKGRVLFLKLLTALQACCVFVCALMHVLQMELKECRLRVAEERRARMKAESRLVEVMIILKILILFFCLLFIFLLFCTTVTSLCSHDSFALLD